MSSLAVKTVRSRSFILKGVIVFLFIGLQFYLIFIKKHFTLDIDAYPNTKPTVTIHGERIVGQTFVAERDHLSKIEIMLGTFGRENDGDVIFELGVSKEKAVEQKVFNAAQVKNNRYHSIVFSSQKNSKGKQYYFTLSSPESTPDNSICAWMNTEDIYPDGQYFFNNQPPGGDLVFRTYSLQPVSAVLGKINENYPGIWGSQIFLILTVILFIALEVVILIKLLDLGYQDVNVFFEQKRRSACTIFF